MPEAQFDYMKYGALGLGMLGLLAGAAGGYVNITTPEAAQCAVDLADARARLELLTEAKDACKEALGVCVKGDQSP
jgi:hypothetical protein